MHEPAERIRLEAEMRPEEVFRTLAAEHEHVYWLDGGPAGPSRIGAGSPVELALGAVLPGLRAALADAPLGIVGWLGYELRAETMGMPVRPADRPPAAFLRVEREYEIPVAAAVTDARDGRRRRGRGEGRKRPSLTAPPRSRDTDAAYLAKIAACQEAIRRGDAYLLCLTTTWRVPGEHDPLAVYAALRASSATGRGGILRTGGVTLLSATPESFLEVGGGVVRTRPIKGTRPRAGDPVEDARLAAELVADEKERAENLMIVDLMRNDLARVCPPGQVAVTGLYEVVSHPQVHQLVSTVEGRLAPGRDALDAIAACFPAGSMTGTPKRRAIELLDGLEGEDRGPYAGAFGRLGPDGSAELAMTIRTIVLDPGGASVSAGGGITALSDPAAELAEARLKARALLSALGVR